MKKFTMLLAAILCLCVCMSAAALEINTTPLYTYETGLKVSLVDHHDRLMFETDDGSAMAMPDGTVLTEPVYRSAYGSSSYYDYIKVTSNTTKVKAEGDDQELIPEGFIDEAGNVIVPVEYLWTNVLNRHWALGARLKKVGAGEDPDISVTVFGGDNFKAVITEYDVYFLDEAKLVATLDRSEIKDIRGVSRCLNIQYNDDSIKGYNSSFECVGEPDRVYGNDYIPADELDPVEPSPERISGPTSKRDNSVGAYGMYAADGSEILAPEWDSVSVNASYGFPLVTYSLKKGDIKYQGIVSVDGRIIVEPTEAKYYIESFNDDYARVQVEDATGKFYGVIDRKGNMVVPAQYKRIDYQKDGMLCIAELEDGAEIWSLTKGRIDVGAVTKDEARITKNDRSVLVEYKGDTSRYAVVSGEGTVTELADAKSVSYISNSKGNLYKKTGTDRTVRIVSSTDKTILENYNNPAINDQATLLLAKNEAENRYELFEIK